MYPSFYNPFDFTAQPAVFTNADPNDIAQPVQDASHALVISTSSSDFDVATESGELGLSAASANVNPNTRRRPTRPPLEQRQRVTQRRIEKQSRKKLAAANNRLHLTLKRVGIETRGSANTINTSVNLIEALVGIMRQDQLLQVLSNLRVSDV